MDHRPWNRVAQAYDPLKAGSIDGTDTDPHDRAIIRAMNAKYKPNRSVDGDPHKTIFVTHLDKVTDEDTLWTAFRTFGKITRCRLVRDIVTGFSKGYGFIEFEDERDAERAIRDGKKMIIDQVEVLVDKECERTLSGWIPRRLGGGIGGNKKSGQLRFGGRHKPFILPLGFDDESRHMSDQYSDRYKSDRNHRDNYRSNRNERYSSDRRRDYEYRKDYRDYKYEEKEGRSKDRWEQR